MNGSSVSIPALPFADRLLGPEFPCCLAAEVGINHNGDMVLAQEMIAAAAEAGADAVKFQNYRVEDFLSDRTLTWSWMERGIQKTESQWDMFRRCELRRDDLALLRDCCERHGVLFFSTPTSAAGVDDLVSCGCNVVKNGSDYLGHLPLIRHMAQSGMTTILSTGMSTLTDIDAATTAFAEAGGKNLLLLLCTSAYPTPAASVHLRRLPHLSAVTGRQVGFSDHTEGIASAIAARVLGAVFIEKHFTLDQSLPGPDHRFSSDPKEFHALVQGVRHVEQALGSAQIAPTAAEAGGRSGYRLSCTSARALSAGHRLSEEDLVYRRPGTGIQPRDAWALLGRCLSRDLASGTVIHMEHLR